MENQKIKHNTSRYKLCDNCDKYILPYLITNQTENDIHWEETCPLCNHILDED